MLVTECSKRAERALAQPSRSRITLKQWAFSAELASDDLRMVAWTEWFLGPWFRRAADPADWQVTFVRDGQFFDQLRRLGAATVGRQVSSCVQHTRESSPSWEWTLPSFRLLHYREFDTFCLALPEKRRLLMVASEQNSRAITAVMRAIRELASLEHQRAGGAIIHAAAMGAANGATLVIAPKRGGKTTFLIRSLLKGARFIANDRAVLYQNGGEIMAMGMPTVISLRDGTLAFFPTVVSELSSRRLHYRRHAGKFGLPGRWVISPLQLCTATGASPISEARVATILFLADRPGEPERLTTDRAVDKLAQSVFDFTDTQGHFFASLHPVDAEGFGRSVEQIWSRVCQQAECWEYPREWGQ